MHELELVGVHPGAERGLSFKNYYLPDTGTDFGFLDSLDAHAARS